MRVSVIVTTYNSPEYLKRVLAGLARQSLVPHEVIVADDGSAPETGEYVRSLSASGGIDSGIEIKHVWHEDMGFRAARIRNLAVKVATGEYVVFLDGDCLVNRHFVADHARLARKGHFLQGKRVIIRRDASGHVSRRETNSPWALLRLALTGGISNFHHILRLPFIPPRVSTGHRGIKTCNMGVFREDIIAVNGFNERFVGWGREDSEFAVRLYNYGLRRMDHPFAAICFHLWHEENARDALKANDEMLRQAGESGLFRCEDGIEKG